LQLVEQISKEGNKISNFGLSKTLIYNTFNYPFLPDYILSIIYLIKNITIFFVRNILILQLSF